MHLHHIVLAISLLAAPSACAPTHDEAATAHPSQPANPLAPFARMLGGEWKMTAFAGTSLFDIWHWGPGQHSMRVMTDGTAANGDSWHALGVVYWHPNRKQLRRLSVSPYERSVSEGTFTFEGDVAESVDDMYQTNDRRRLKSRWTFHGPDAYHDELLEATGPAGYVALADWERKRIALRTSPRATHAGDSSPKPSAYLKALEAPLGHTWETTWKAMGEAVHEATLNVASADSSLQTMFEYVPYADAIYAQVMASTKGGEATHLLDAYVYHHTGTGTLRCLALSEHGAVYEGDVSVLDGGALQIALTGYVGDEVVPLVVRLDFEGDGSVRHRVWSDADTGRTLMFDVHHQKVEHTEVGLPDAR